MKFQPTKFDDAYLIEQDRHVDARGYFARSWCQREFDDRGLSSRVVQSNISFNSVGGTLRGMHFQAPPHEEIKLVRCTRGSIFDVIVDVRVDSKQYGVWQGFELTADNGRALYIPKGFAHGFQTLMADCEVLYQMSEFYHPGSATAFHYADPAVGIDWPRPVALISDDDAKRSTLGSLSASLSINASAQQNRVLGSESTGFVDSVDLPNSTPQ